MFFGLRTQQTQRTQRYPPLSMDVVVRANGENPDDTVVSDADCDRF